MGIEPGPQWRRLLKAAAAAMEREAASFSLSDPDTAERHLIIGITGRHRRAAQRRLRLSIAELEAHVAAQFGVDLKELILTELGIEVGAARRRRLERDAGVGRLLAEARRSSLSGAAWFGSWLEALRSNGALAELARDGESLAPVIRALEALPVDDVPMPVLAERMLGDTKALASGRSRGLLLRALSAWRGIEYPEGSEAERELLEWAGIVSDDIASQVLVLNLPITGGVVGEWMRSARGVPFRITLQQLRLEPFSVAASTVRVVENPSILRAAADALGPDCPPLVCTEGVPSAAVYRLLEAATGARLLWRADFDWAGLRIVERGLDRFPGAEPWRMSSADFESGVKGIGLRGKRIKASWDESLSALMEAEGRAVMEESLLEELLEDLRLGT
ncbi:TIGR02679 family protein [Glycomyces salinus]|uniref:TIGR02679 family protein n=1 Tax=Glycomyces salinus TaxID=980294 RepID=UPI0018ED7911|nr:TIGR02679 family protein [Glycomyces salinus]